MRKKELIVDKSQIKIIRKANELVEARYRFDIWEMRVFAKMLMTIRTADKDLQKYQIHISEIIKDFNLLDAGDNYTSIKDAANKLLTKVIEIEKETPEGSKWVRIPLLIAVEGFKNKSEGNYISVQFHPELKPFLMELKERYLQYDIRNLWGLTSVYSVRMYELLKQYERIGKRYFDVENLRLILGINPSEYKLYGHFKNKIILKAQNDLKEVTDIHFAFKEKKDSRRVVGLTFQILRNETTVLSHAETPAETVSQNEHTIDETVLNALYEQVKGWGITLSRLRQLFVLYGEKRLKNGLDCTLDSISEGKVKGNKVGFFTKAVEENWMSQKQVEKNGAEDKKQQRTNKVAEMTLELSQLELELKNMLDMRGVDANDEIKKLTQDDPLVATEAIGKIISNKILVNLLEKQTGLKIKDLTIDDWRYNAHLRAAVLQQIELLHPSVFEGIKKRYDAPMKNLKRQIEVLKKEVG
jgi:plasmid replication initiation protein